MLRKQKQHNNYIPSYFGAWHIASMHVLFHTTPPPFPPDSTTPPPPCLSPCVPSLTLLLASIPAKANDCTWTVFFHTHGPVSFSSQCINIQYFHHMSILSHASCTFCSVLQSHCNHINIVSKLTNSFTNTL